MHTILGLLQQNANQSPDKPLYFFLGKNSEITDKLTIGETYQKARAFAQSFSAMGLQGERCILMYQPGLDVIPAFLGCLYAGIIAVPAFPLRKNTSSLRIKAIITDSQAKVVCTTRKVYESVSKLFGDDPVLRGLAWICTDELPQTTDTTTPAETYSPEKLAYLQYTSGSTGTPKGTMITHGNIVANLEAIDETCRHTPDSVIVSWMPVFHDMGLIYGVLQPIYSACVSYLMPPMLVMQSPIEWLEAISKYKANYSTGPNFAYDYCVEKISEEQKAGLDLSSWIAAGCAAEPIRPATLKKFAESFAVSKFAPLSFAPCYGLAECTLKVSGVEMHKPVTYLAVDASQLEGNKIAPAESNDGGTVLVGCGIPSSNTIVKIVDPETCLECEPFSIGEIWVQSPSVAVGFWNRPEETEAVFHAVIKGTSEGPFLRTGDLGFMHGGEVFVTGRRKELIIIRGTNHYPQDIEQTIKESTTALRNSDGAAFSVEVNGKEELVVVFEINGTLVVGEEVLANRAQIISDMKEMVFQNHDISIYDIVFIRNETLPKTSSGKIQRIKCKEDYLASAFKGLLYRTSDSSAPKAAREAKPEAAEGTPLQKAGETVDISQWLLQSLAEILNIAEDEIENDEPFASYGLDSSIAAGLTGKISQEFNLEIEPTVFWEYSTIDTLSEHLLHRMSVQEVS